ncbi:hypothetical protein [Streptomyces sp. NBC_01235]|uniref:hypothetical protein n=1 Tax=Streptomyces sp. NBC_01235 TaxID=2903788 RepID=UPI002E14D632|nr:hypothetical protein OG289_27590 [Streptomyces sp. NBC_01235]
MNSAKSPARSPAGLATAVVLATTGGLLTAAVTAVSAATTCASPVHKRQIFAGTTFSGTAKQTGRDAAIAGPRGTKAPPEAYRRTTSPSAGR